MHGGEHCVTAGSMRWNERNSVERLERLTQISDLLPIEHIPNSIERSFSRHMKVSMWRQRRENDDPVLFRL